MLLSLRYDDTLGLDTAEMILGEHTDTGPIAHQMLLFLPDGADSFSQLVQLEVWGRKAGKRAAYGSMPPLVLAYELPDEMTLVACAPGCHGDMLVTCTLPAVACPLGCSGDDNNNGVNDAHCNPPPPSNGVDATAAVHLTGTTKITGTTTFNVDTGQISGALIRAPGVDSGLGEAVGYVQAPPLRAGGAPLGIFVFHNLEIQYSTVRFVGTRAVVLLVGDTATISGIIDVSGGHDLAGHDARATPGPGGGAGGSGSVPAQGCGAGESGHHGTAFAGHDSGGAGGSAGQAGAAGGSTSTVIGGAPRPACLPEGLEPLQGGSGGGAGAFAFGSVAGGGGGGAIQITALNRLEITGRINAGGAGGQGGLLIGTDTAAAGGGGSGGAILLEAPTVIVGAGASLAANGGGGGGGAGYWDRVGISAAGEAGANAYDFNAAARGGFGELDGSSGGNGGYLEVAAAAGDSEADTSNGGGGGGGVGAVVIRGRVVMLDGRSTPPAVQLDVKSGAAR